MAGCVAVRASITFLEFPSPTSPDSAFGDAWPGFWSDGKWEIGHRRALAWGAGAGAIAGKGREPGENTTRGDARGVRAR